MPIEHIPPIGYGAGTAWFSGYEHNSEGELDEDLIRSIRAALETGFTHLDLAEMYGNEREVGEALKAWFAEGHPRDELWITSKCLRTMNNIEKGCRSCLDRLGVEFLDLYMLHAPPAWNTHLEEGRTAKDVWADMEALVEKKLVRRIGISNFRGSDVQEIMKTATIAPYVNQVEFHPYLQQPKLQAVCQGHGIRMAAYSPLYSLNKRTGGPVDAVVSDLAMKHGTTESAILLRFTQQKGYCVITTTRTPDRMLASLLSVADPGAEGVPPMLSDDDIKLISDAGHKSPHRGYWLQKGFSDSEALQDAGDL